MAEQRNLWVGFGYRRHFGIGKLLWLNPRAHPWRTAVVEYLASENASCLFHSLAAIIPTEALMQRVIHHVITTFEDGLTRGYTVPEAVQLLLDLDVPLSIVSIDLVDEQDHWYWRVVRRWRHPQVIRRGAAIVAVDYDDEMNFAPHFVPASSFRLNMRCPLVQPELMALRPQVAPPAPPPVDPVPAGVPGDELGLPFADVEDWADLVAVIADEIARPEEPMEIPDYWTDTRVRHEAALWDDPDRIVSDDLRALRAQDGIVANNSDEFGRVMRHPLANETAICGVYPPPVPIGNSLVSMRTFYRVMAPGVPLIRSRGMAVVERMPNAFDRACARSAGSGGIVWELRPGVIDKAQVSSRHKVYAKMAPPHILDERLMASGDFDPRCVCEVHTETGAYSLVDPQVVEVVHEDAEKEVFVFFGMRRTAATALGCTFRCLPFHLEEVTSVSFIRDFAPSFSLPLSSFPSRYAWLRAQFSILVQQCPEELKATLIDQRNQVFEAAKADTLSPSFDPVKLLQDLHRYSVAAKLRLAATINTPYLCR